MKRKIHKKNNPHVKVPEKFLEEVLHLLAESQEYLDRDFAWEKTDELDKRINKVLDKAGDMKFPVRPY